MALAVACCPFSLTLHSYHHSECAAHICRRYGTRPAGEQCAAFHPIRRSSRPEGRDRCVRGQAAACICIVSLYAFRVSRKREVQCGMDCLSRLDVSRSAAPTHCCSLHTSQLHSLRAWRARGERKDMGGGGGVGAAWKMMHLHNRRIGYGRGGHQSYHEIYPHFGTSKSFWMRQVSGFTPCATKSPGSEVG